MRARLQLVRTLLCMDLRENFYGCQLLSCESKFFEDPFTNVRARVVNMRTCDKTCARAFTTRTRAFLLRNEQKHYLIYSETPCMYIFLWGGNYGLFLQLAPLK